MTYLSLLKRNPGRSPIEPNESVVLQINYPCILTIAGRLFTRDSLLPSATRRTGAVAYRRGSQAQFGRRRSKGGMFASAPSVTSVSNSLQRQTIYPYERE